MPLPIHPFPPWEGDSEPEWMRDWRTNPREIVLASDDPVIWPILEAHYEGRAIRFLYLGASGDCTRQIRACVPEVVFRIKGFSSTWFEGFCQLRRARRTFNCSLVDFVPPGTDETNLPIHPFGWRPGDTPP
jgi:hypothetical protein